VKAGVIPDREDDTEKDGVAGAGDITEEVKPGVAAAGVIAEGVAGTIPGVPKSLSPPPEFAKFL